MFTTFLQFLEAQYNERCENPTVKAIYEKDGGFEKFKANFVEFNDMKEYLETLRGLELTESQFLEIVKTYHFEFNRKISEIPAILISISRLYDLEIPAIYGITTQEYWESKLS